MKKKKLQKKTQKKAGLSKTLKFLISIVVCQAAGALGSVFTVPSIRGWYAGLQKAPFNPPNWVFGPAWTLLYLLMGISLYIIWVKGFEKKGAKDGLLVFFIQLALNILWSIAFFGMHSPLAGMVIILLLWAFILLTIVYFYRVSKAAGLLQIPYLAWVSFASALNFFVYMLNR